MSEFARRHGIEVASLRRWRAAFAAATVADEAPRFVELRVEPSAQQPAPMTLEVGHARLVLGSPPDPHWLAAPLQALAAQPC